MTTTENNPTLDFGYAPAIERAQLDRSPAIWGARAIVENNDTGFGLVPGRNSWYTEDLKAREALVLALNNGVLDACRAEFVRLRHKSWEINRVPQEYVLFEDESIVVVGNTNGSYGYLYLAAYIKPSDFTGVWSGDWRPVTGDEVEVRINGIGRARVLRGHRSFDVAGLYVMPVNPPDWYRKQNRLGERGWKPGWITGREFTNVNTQEVA